MNAEFFEALTMLEKEKGIPCDYLIEKISNAIVNALKRDYGVTENAVVEIDIDKQKFRVAIRKEIVEEVTNPNTQIQVDEAHHICAVPQLGEFAEVEIETKQFGRIAAQTAKHVIRQGIREAERGQMLAQFQSQEHELVTAVVQRIDPKTRAATLEIGKAEAVLPVSEQVPGEILRENDHIKVYVVEVRRADKGPRAMISRTHPGLVKRLFELEVPEIYEGIVEIKAVSREAGSRTKLAVCSKDTNVDPVGACIGPKGTRVNEIVSELNGEKIDIIKYNDDPALFVAEALSPADVLKVEVNELQHSCRVIVPDNQLSLAIGKEGQNARLAARLTGWKIDIRPESQA
jgi:N utilization substance protein A